MSPRKGAPHRATSHASISKYRLHRQSKQAIVTINGRDHLLGPHGARASQTLHDRLIAEWLANGRQPVISADGGLTITELVAHNWKFAQSHYVNDGESNR